VFLVFGGVHLATQDVRSLHQEGFELRECDFALVHEVEEVLFALQTDDYWNEQFYANMPLELPPSFGCGGPAPKHTSRQPKLSPRCSGYTSHSGNGADQLQSLAEG